MQLNTRVLVMDDEPLVRLMICSALEQAEYSVMEASTCAEALELVRGTAFDVAVLDYRLPDGDGLDVVARMEAEGQGIPVIMLSGESLEIKEQAERFESVQAVLPKPPDNEQLLDSVAAAVGKKTQRRTQVGRYVCISLDVVAEGMNQEEWLAVDLSSAGGVLPETSVLNELKQPRCGMVFMGADATQRAYFEAEIPPAEYVSDLDELAALSRRPSSPVERDLLLQSIIQPGEGTHA